jgi:hypothetical protein
MNCKEKKKKKSDSFVVLFLIWIQFNCYIKASHVYQFEIYLHQCSLIFVFGFMLDLVPSLA